MSLSMDGLSPAYASHFEGVAALRRLGGELAACSPGATIRVSYDLASRRGRITLDGLKLDRDCRPVLDGAGIDLGLLVRATTPLARWRDGVAAVAVDPRVSTHFDVVVSFGPGCSWVVGGQVPPDGTTFCRSEGPCPGEGVTRVPLQDVELACRSALERGSGVDVGR